MKKSDANQSSVFGFLTVVQHEQHGYFGGYLLLNSTGRPIEFHCSSPVRPNRAQEILYGPTLEPYLYGELIGQTLVQQASRPATVICTDHAGVLALQDFVDVPVLLVESAVGADGAAHGNKLRVDAAHGSGASHRAFELGQHRVALTAHRAGDEQHIRSLFEPVLPRLDLSEPFSRICEALDEAQRGQR